MLSFLEDLKQPQAYPHPTGDIVLRQTHISYLFMAGRYVYKIKKPVDFGFLDFTTLAKRKHFCGEELRLNRRLCPDIYLDVVPVTRRSEGGCFFGEGPGEIVEYGVRMARMADEKMMDNMISAGALTEEMLADIVEVLVPFYREAETGPEIVKAGSAAAVAGNFRENFEQTQEFIGDPELGRECYAAIRGYVDDFLAREDLFRMRQDQGRIRDGHGDLHSANICLEERVHIFDCIEFSTRLRYGDSASDIAFLAMDLDYHDLPDMAGRFVDLYIDRSGDASLPEVLDFYKCYRAYVRGKIGLFTGHAREIDEATRTAGLARAKKYFRLAERYAAGG